MQNAKQLDVVYQNAINSQGSAMKEQEAYMNSLEGKINQFTENVKGLFMELIDTDWVKGVLSGADSLIDFLRECNKVFGSLPTIIGTATTAMLVFNKSFRTSATSLPIINKIKQSITGLGQSSSLTTSITNSLNKSLKFMGTSSEATARQARILDTTLTGVRKGASLAGTAIAGFATIGASLALGALVTSVMKLGDELVLTTGKFVEMNKEFASNNGEVTSKISEVDKLIRKYEDLNRAKANPEASSEQLASADKELLEIQQRLAEIYPEVATAIGDDGKAKAINLDITKQMVSLEKQKQQAEAQSVISSNKQLDSLKKLTKFGETYKKNLEESAEASRYLASGTTEVTKEFKYMNGDVQKTVNYTDDLAYKQEKLTKKISESQSVLMGQREAYVTLSNGSNLYKEEIALLDELLSYTTSSTDDLNYSTQGLTEGFDAIGDSAETATQKIEGLADAYSGTNDTVKFLEKTIEEFTNKGQLSSDTVGDILNKYTNFIPLLYEETDVIALANEYLGVQSQLREDSKNQAIQAYREEQEAMVANENERIRLEQEEIRLREEKIAGIQALEEEKKNSMTRVSEHNIKANLVEEDRKLVDSMEAEAKRQEVLANSKNIKNTIYAEDSDNYRISLMDKERAENESLGRSQKIRADQARNMSTIYAEGSDNEKSAFLQAEAEKRRVESENNLLRSQENSKRMRDQSTMYAEDSKKANVEANKKLQDEKTALDKVKEANEIANRNKSTIYAEDTNNYKTELDNKLSATKTYVDSINEAISKIKDKTVTVTTENVVKNSSTGASSSTSRPNTTPQSIDMQGLSQMRSALVSDLSDTYTSKQQAYAEANKIIQQRTATPTSYSTGGTKSVKVGENNINIVLSNIGGSNANNINVETNKILERMLGELQNARSINFNIDKINAIDQGSKEATAHSVSYVLGSYIRK